ncbi:hypothetical protein A9R01_05550 ['Osedax' symbiont bacterium Rs2_46_30_T18]|nr:hypothetical protein A9R01_05550 ['Osedax' symbiont bacterium Rs2_46_30_T18]
MLQLESVNPVPVITKITALHKEQPLPDELITELEQSFEATINSEVQQHKRELIDFIDSEIGKLGTEDVK